MVRRLASLLLISWALGFILFAVFLPKPLPPGPSDGIVVLTGGEGRIARGLDLLRVGKSHKLLVAGVDTAVRKREFAAEYGASPALMDCCVTLGYQSVDTTSNAQEAERWISANRLRSVRLVTSDWHMRRAAHDLRAQLPTSVTVLQDAVSSHPSLRMLFLEYHKLLARRIAALWGD